MKVVSFKHQIVENLAVIRQSRVVGFVPTMGALHSGHLSLVEAALRQDCYVVVSIFVNPTQFNNSNDLIHYPRSIEEDLELLEKAGADLVFTPTVEEIYPEEIISSNYEFNGLDMVMEGAHRPGHFLGMATVVDKLFQMVTPRVAFFGEKDFQQLAIIRHLNQTLNWDIDIVGCPIIREQNGLAKSSRNLRLSESGKQYSAVIFQILNALKEQARAHGIPSTVVVKNIRNEILSGFDQKIELEYCQMVNEITLQMAHANDNLNDCRVFIAAIIEGVRLIDNLSLKQ